MHTCPRNASSARASYRAKAGRQRHIFFVRDDPFARVDATEPLALWVSEVSGDPL